MQCTLWNSADVKPASEFDYYHTGLCEAFARLTPYRPEAGHQFSAKMEHWVGNAHEFTFLQTVSHRVARSKHDINQAEDKNIYLNFIELGELQLEQDGKRHILKRGDLAIIDNAKPFDVQINSQKGHRHLAFRISRERFKLGTDELAYRLNSHPLTSALKNAVSYLCKANTNWSPDRVETLAQTIENLAVIVATGNHQTETCSRARATVAKVQSQITAHLSDPDFSLEIAARNLRMPSRSIQNHLHTCGTHFSALLMSAKLSHAHNLLKYGPAETSIEEIAYRSGFNELSTFYRSFKTTYGVAPGAARNMSHF